MSSQDWYDLATVFTAGACAATGRTASEELPESLDAQARRCTEIGDERAQQEHAAVHEERKGGLS